MPSAAPAALEGGKTGPAVLPGSPDALLPTAGQPPPPDCPADAPGGPSCGLPPCDDGDDGPCIFPLDRLLMREPSSEASDPPYQGPGLYPELPEDRRLRWKVRSLQSFLRRTLRGSHKVGERYRYLSEAHVRLKTQLCEANKRRDEVAACLNMALAELREAKLDYWSARDKHIRLSAELDRYRAMLAPAREDSLAPGTDARPPACPSPGGDEQAGPSGEPLACPLPPPCDHSCPGPSTS